MSHSPDAMLKSALEKIVYFEARSTQLSNDLAQARSEAESLRADVTAAAQREIELRRVVAELEVRVTRAHAEREESARMAEALRRERAELIGQILDASRIQRAGTEADDFDLSQFIAELRSEVLLNRGNASGKTTESAAPSSSPSGVNAIAASLRAEGRLTVSEAQLTELGTASAFPGRSEETLFGFSVRELSALDGAARVRAAERLQALAHPAAASALATALHGESHPPALVAMLSALASLAKVEAVPVIQPHLTSPHPDVRIAALKALLKLDATHAAPHVSAAMKDPEAAVRRRASLLSLSLRGNDALALGAQAIHDADGDVRSLGALVLGASGSAEARPLLLEAMRDVDARVRSSASEALSRVLGRDVTAMASLDDSQRRREVRRLSQVPSKPVTLPSTIHGSSSAARDGARTSMEHAGASTLRAGAAHRAASNAPAVRASGSAHDTSVRGSTHHATSASQRGVVTVHTSHADGTTHRATMQQSDAVYASHADGSAHATMQQSAAAYASHADESAHATMQQSAAVYASHADRSAHASHADRPVRHTTAGSQGGAPAMHVSRADGSAPQAVRTAMSPALAQKPASARVAVLEVPAEAPAPAVLSGVMTELRTAIRGRPLDELTSAVGTTNAQTMQALSVLMQRGDVVRRGHKYFVA